MFLRNVSLSFNNPTRRQNTVDYLTLEPPETLSLQPEHFFQLVATFYTQFQSTLAPNLDTEL